MDEKNVAQIFEKMSKKLREIPERTKGIGNVIAIVLEGEDGGRWIINCKDVPASVTRDPSSSAEATVSMSTETFVDLIAGKVKPEMAFFSNKIKLDGSMAQVIKFAELFSSIK